MKLLGGFYTSDAAYSLRRCLEEAGIAALVVHSKTHIKRKAGFEYLVFCALDEQLEDAVQVMRNPSHIVAHPVDVAAYHAYLASSSSLEIANRSLTTVLIGAIGVLVLLVAALVWRELSR